MSKKKRRPPVGASVVCLDAMILIGYAEADLVDVLGSFFTREGVHAYTSAWLLTNEIAIPAEKYEHNRRILEADWLETAPVEDEDILYVQNLRAAWGSDDGRDQGEAEVVALCTKYGWTGASDDNKAHGVPELKGQSRPFRPAMVHAASLLACAAADNLIGNEDAWQVHQAVEKRYTEPPLLPIEDEYAQALEEAVTVIRKRRDQFGSPPWPLLLTHEPDSVLHAAVRRRTGQLGH